MSMNRTCAISSSISFLTSAAITTSVIHRPTRVSESADHSGADQTLDRAGELLALAAPEESSGRRVFAESFRVRISRGQVRPFALPRERAFQSALDQAPRPSRPD